MAENSKGQGEKPWIPPNLAAVLHGPVPKSQLIPIDHMPPRELSSQQPRSRFATKPTMEEMRSRFRRSRSPPRPRHIREPRSIKETRYRSMRSRSPIPPPRVDKFSRLIQEMQPQSSFLNSPLQRRDGMELKSVEDMRPQTKRRIELMGMSVDTLQITPRSIQEMQPQTKRRMEDLMDMSVDKVQLTPSSIEELQPQTKRSISSLRRRNDMELNYMKHKRHQPKRRPQDLVEPRSIDKLQLTPRSIEELQPQTKRSISSLRPLIVMKSKSIDKIPTLGEVPNVLKVSLKSSKTIPIPSTDNYSKEQKFGRQTFHKFSDLPLELQIMIWQWYGRIHANSNPNIIKIFRCFRPVLQNLTVRENPSERIPYFAISYKLPPIFYVCKLTFTIAKDLYENEFQVIPMIKDDKQLTYFNEDRDIIALEDAQVLRDWRYNRQTEAESTGRAHMNLFRPAAEKITRRINMKHLVIGGTDRSLIEARQLARFYDCESVMLGVPYLVRSRFFSTEERSKPDREAISTLRDRLLRFWKEERRSLFVREDYRRKPIRPVVVEPNWDPTERTISNPMFFICTDGEILSQLHRLHPAITNFMTPPPGAKSSITFMNDMKFSHKHARLFEHPWEFVSKE
ncbi:uncharacterized protein EAE97_011901 [Botrytis byssoidea]|uniref:2EXR domain-containing protein n=1 Tax=Botrytis byssoidea TaxID=139641 RepID=A0A9P5LRL0_9HELO|nr:uncharacterized protein EAE97_011901 [Botrytis byssoidea]KAF7918130.1 hypothetical protein EAE97_011901 [Botrytis byssoidea]